MAQIAQGVFAGNGTSQSVTVSDGSSSFQPDFVWVKTTSSSDTSVLKTSSMTTDLTKNLNNVNGVLFSNGITLTSTGFDVGSDLRCNRNAVNVHYLAMKFDSGSNGAAGTYVGDASNPRDISVGFTPDLAIVMNDAASASAAQWGDTSYPGTAANEGGPFSTTHGSGLIPLPWAANAFTVSGSSSVNAAGVTAYYLALQSITGFFESFSYSGDGSDNRNLDLLTFQPDFVYIQRVTSASSTGAMWYASLGGDNVLTIQGTGQGSNVIQGVRPNGFQIGFNNIVNNSISKYCGFAFKIGSTAPHGGGGGGGGGKPPSKKGLRTRGFYDPVRSLLKREYWQQNRMLTVLDDRLLRHGESDVRVPPAFYDPWRRWGTPATLLEPVGSSPPVFTPDISRSLQIDTNPSDVPAIDSNPSDAPIIDTNPSDSPSLEV